MVHTKALPGVVHRVFSRDPDVLARLEDTATPDDIEVLECNWTTVTIWTHCIPAYAGMGQRVGVPATEVRAALLVMRVPRSEWPTVLTGVRVMDRACGSN